MSDQAKSTLESALKECEIHCQRIQRSRELLSSCFPLEVSKFEKLSEEMVEHLDQFIYRFIKMQDSMGNRLFPSLYRLIEADSTPRPFLDLINRLEKLGAIKNVEEWQFFRNLRNNLAHDYPESSEQTVDTLNILMSKIDQFLSIFFRARDYYREFQKTSDL